MKNFVFIFLFVFHAAFAQEIDKITIVVDDQVVTASDIKKRLNFAVKFLNISDQNVDKTKLEDQIIQNLIEEKLIANEAKKLKIEVTDDEIEYFISNIERSNNNTKGTIWSEIKSHNIDKNVALDYFRAKIFFSKVIHQKLSPIIHVNDKEIEEVLGTIIPENTEISFKQIIVNPELIANEQDLNKYLEKLNKLRYKIKKCDDLNKISANEKLDINDIKLPLSSLHQDLRNMIRILPIGHASPIIKSNAGPQIIVVCNRDYSELSDKDKEEIKYLITERKLEKQSLHFINKLRQKAYIEIYH